MASQNKVENLFQQEIEFRYKLYKNLLEQLPFSDMEDYGIYLSLFTKEVEAGLKEKLSPITLVEKFFEKYFNKKKEPEQLDLLFKFVQFIERQVTLFDALEEASFEKLVDLGGEGSLSYLLENVLTKGKTEELVEFLQEYRVRIVLTAHPTQFYTTPVLGILYKLYLSIKENDVISLKSYLLQLAKTSFRNSEKPTLKDEAESILVFLKQTLYKALPDIQRRLKERLSTELGRDIDLPPLLEIGFWPGGDRDGNPFVTSKTTLDVANMLQKSILERYIHDIKAIAERLTFKGIYPALKKVQRRLIHSLHAHRQDDTYLDDEGPYFHPDEILADLNKILEALQRGDFEQNFHEPLILLMEKVRSFGLHFATIDLRQDAGIHNGLAAQLVAHYLGKEDYLQQNDAERCPILLSLIRRFLSMSSKEKKFSCKDENSAEADVFATVQAALKIQAINGEKGLNRYVVSHTARASDILELLLFFAYIGASGEDLNFDFIPLFETIADLEEADKIMDRLYSIPLYRRHVEKRRNRQIVMLGYSDGTKDGGYFSANWSIFRAKERLSEISKKAKLSVIFFDGRGGPPARGGGETHKFYRSLSDKMQKHEIHLTVQGQTISSSFFTFKRACFNVEQLFTAGIENRLFLENEARLNKAERKLLEKMAAISFEKYEALKQDPNFVPYLEEITPLRFFGLSNVGSRPSSRSQAGAGVDFGSLRAIPFVSSWNQIKQNVPAYFGLGKALHVLFETEGLAVLQDLYKNSLFFRTLLGNAMQSLMKTNFALTAYLKHDKKFGDFWKTIYNEAMLSEKMLLKISGQKQLLENLVFNRLSITQREKIVHPLLIIQQYACMVLRKNQQETGLAEKNIEAYEKLIVRSLAGNINASRNSA